MSKTRALRLSDRESKEIEEFLKANPFFDFSSLARLAIKNFIYKPQVEFKPLKNKKVEHEH